MQLATFAVLGALAIFGPMHVALATCTAELSYRDSEPKRPLPSACHAMGLLRLGMSYANVVKILGVPNASMPFGDNEEALVYALSQAPRARDRHVQATADPDNGFLRIILHDRNVVSLWALGSDSSAAP